MGVPADYKPAVQPLIPYPKVPGRNDPNFAYFGSNTVWITLKNGTVQRTTCNDNLNPWRQQSGNPSGVLAAPRASSS